MSPVTARGQAAAHTESSQVGLLANTLHSLAFSLLLLATSGWRWAPSVGLGWGPPLLHNRGAKAGTQEGRETLYQQFCLLDSEMVLGGDIPWFSESAPVNLTSIHTRTASRRMGSRDTLTY